MASNYDPFSMRKKKTPDFPSVFGQPGTPGGVKPVQPGWELPFQHVTGATDNLPAFPDGAAGPSGQPVIPEFPGADAGWQKLMEGVHSRRSIRSSQDKDGDGIPDVQFANDLIGQLDEMMKMVNGIGGDASAGQSQPPDMSAQEQQHEEAPATRSRDWMFQKRDGWDGPKQGGSNYTPAPVTFNNTNSKDWGTRLDDRPGRSGPAASTVRYYDRALARAEGGSKADQNRVARLRLRIQGRPTNG